MAIEYDKYYLTENLFGDSYPELVDFFSGIKRKGKLLDLGCGQGRNSIALARLGYEVTGIDISKVGIKQLQEIAAKENLSIEGLVGNMYEFAHFREFDFILLDSIFHFNKRDRKKEASFLEKVIAYSKTKTLITICIQNTGKKIEILNSILFDLNKGLELVVRKEFVYTYKDKVSSHQSDTGYEMITVRKIKEGKTIENNSQPSSR